MAKTKIPNNKHQWKWIQYKMIDNMSLKDIVIQENTTVEAVKSLGKGSIQVALYQMISQQMNFEQHIPDERRRPSYPANKSTPVLPPNENNYQNIESNYPLDPYDDHYSSVSVTDNDSNNDSLVLHSNSTTDDSMDHRTIHTTDSFFIKRI